MEFYSATPELAMNRSSEHLHLYPPDTTYVQPLRAAECFSGHTLSSTSTTIHRKAINLSQPPLWLSYLVDAFTQQAESRYNNPQFDTKSPNSLHQTTLPFRAHVKVPQPQSGSRLHSARPSTYSKPNKMPQKLKKRRLAKLQGASADVVTKNRISRSSVEQLPWSPTPSASNLHSPSDSASQASFQTPRMASSASLPSTSDSSTSSVAELTVSNNYESPALSPVPFPSTRSTSNSTHVAQPTSSRMETIQPPSSSAHPVNRKRKANNDDSGDMPKPTKKPKPSNVNIQDTASALDFSSEISELSAPDGTEISENQAPRKLCLEDQFKELVSSAANSDHQVGPRTRRKRNSDENNNLQTKNSKRPPKISPKAEGVVSGVNPISQDAGQAHPSANTKEDTTVPDSVKTQQTHQVVSKPAKKKASSHLVSYDVTFQEYKSKIYWPEYDDDNKVYYAADGITQHPSSQRDSSAKGSPRKRSRGGGAARGRSNGNGNGIGKLRSKFRGRGGRDDTPEPPPRKRNLTVDEEDRVKKLKARQQELKRFFSIVGAHQIEILNQLASKDLNKMIRKAKTHRNVPEYAEVVEDLEDMRDSACDVVKAAYASQIDHEKERYEWGKAVIESQYLNHCKEAQKEYQQGCEGDMALLKQAHAAAEDDTRTETGSEIDYFPRYHEFPEPDAHVRGYTSHRLKDEKPFKQYLATYDDQARQEVIDEDLIRPMIQAINDRNKEHREEQLRKKTQNIEALSETATKELEEIRGYLVPRPLYESENASYALSALADVSDWVSQQYPDKKYIYMPLAPGDTFPREALDFDPPPSKRQLAPALNGKPAPQTSSSIHSRSYSQVHHQIPARNDLFAQNNVNGYHSKPASALPTTAPTPLPQISTVMHGPGQPIAPAPPKSKHVSKPSFGSQLSPITSAPLLPHSYKSAFSPPPPTQLPNLQQNFRQTPLPTPLSRANSGRTQSTRPQQFNFLPPQQPVGHKSAPLASPSFAQGSSTMAAIGLNTNPGRPTIGTPTNSANAVGTSAGRDLPGDASGILGGSAPSSSSGTPYLSGTNGPLAVNSGGIHGSGQGKIPVTFVNQTVASRKAAAEAASQQAALRAMDDRGQGSMLGGRMGGGADKKSTGSVDGKTSGSKSGPRLLLPKV